MRRRIEIFMLTVIFSMLCMACDQKDDNDVQTSMSAQQIRSIVESSNWQVTYFYDTDHEETSNFSGYSFSFNEDGTLVAVNGNTTVTGSWSINDNSGSSSDDDGSSCSNDNDLIIFFESPEEFEDLTDDWDIISISNDQIELIDVSGGNGGTDYLTFNRL
jgi:hypothetical protein